MAHGKRHTRERSPRPKAGSRAAPSGGRATIRIVVADEQPIDREGLVALLEREPDFVVVGRAASSAVAVQQCRALRPAVLVLDSRMPDLDGVPAITAVRTAAPGTHFLAVADRAEDRCLVLSPPGCDRQPGRGPGSSCEHGTDCLQLAVMRGALGAIRRSAEVADLFRAIRVVAAGDAWFEKGTAARLIARAQDLGAPGGADALTIRDLEVAALIAEGRCNKEIARALRIGETTVKKHIGRILGRLGLHDRLQLGLYLARHPLLLGRLGPAVQ